ncbi:hypothetical protein GCM10022295_92400 [Streptomyces osmaniensis]|uniref:Uncharacterized protein n=1 Tax=Streptomyces osmaniensis TaxID=593134 RepID=A0ABP6Z2Q0_9ACTN
MGWGEPAASVSFSGDDEHSDPFHRGMRDIEYGTIRNQQGPMAEELSVDALLNGASP